MVWGVWAARIAFAFARSIWAGRVPESSRLGSTPRSIAAKWRVRRETLRAPLMA